MSAAEPGAISVRITRTAQLFNVLDPSPFHEKDLDPEADKFIFEWARDLGERPYRIEVELPDAELAAAEAARVPDAIRNHFRLRLQSERRKLRHELWRGRTALVIGLLFLSGCIALRELLGSFGDGGFWEVLGEGLLIAGWVAMWGPLEIFLYGWWPIAGTCRTLGRLAEAEVDLRAAALPRNERSP